MSRVIDPIRNTPVPSTVRNACTGARNQRHVRATVETSMYSGTRSRQGRQVTIARGKRKEDISDVDVVFDGMEEDERGLANSPATFGQTLGSIGVVADRLTEAVMQFVPEGTSFEVVRIAVIGGVALVILSCVKGLLSLVLTIGTVGFGAYVYTNIYGGASEREASRPRRYTGSDRRTKSSRKAKGRETKSGGGSPGTFLTSLLDSTGVRKKDDGLLDVTFKKPNKTNTKK